MFFLWDTASSRRANANCLKVVSSKLTPWQRSSNRWSIVALFAQTDRPPAGHKILFNSRDRPIVGRIRLRGRTSLCRDDDNRGLERRGLTMSIKIQRVKSVSLLKKLRIYFPKRIKQEEWPPGSADTVCPRPPLSQVQYFVSRIKKRQRWDVQTMWAYDLDLWP